MYLIKKLSFSYCAMQKKGARLRAPLLIFNDYCEFIFRALHSAHFFISFLLVYRACFAHLS